MTQEQIIALDSKKHIKIWLLHKQGLTRRQIADLLGTNPGHVGNEIKAYAVNKEKRDAAEAILQDAPPPKIDEDYERQRLINAGMPDVANQRFPIKKANETAYQKASKIPKGGAVNATPDNLNAWAAETIAKKHAMQPDAIYNWAKKHGVDLPKHGHILSKVESNSALLADVLNDKYSETKALIESGPTLEYPVYQNESNGKKTLVKTFSSHKEAENWINNDSRKSDWYFYSVGNPIEKVKTENKPQSFGDRMKEAREKKAQEREAMSPEEVDKESFNKLLLKVDSLSGKEILKHFGLRDDQNMFGTAKRGTIFDRQYTYLSEDKYHIEALKPLYVLDKKMPLTIKLVSQKMVSSEQEHRMQSGEDTESEYGVSKTSQFIIEVFYKKSDFKVATLKNTSFSSEIKPVSDAYQLLKDYFRNKTPIAAPIDFKTAEEVINNIITYKLESTAWRKNKVSEEDKKKAKTELDRWYDESWKSIKERLKERGFKSSHQLYEDNKAVLDNTYRAGILLSRTPLYKAFEMRIDYEMQKHPYNTVSGQIMASKSDIIAKYSEEASEQREKYRHGYDSQSFAASKLAEDLNSVLGTTYSGSAYSHTGSMVGFGVYSGTKKFGDGGILEGPKHGSGGIKATLPDGNPIELEGGEIIINAKAAKENCAELSKINQSTGNGVAFPCNNPALDGIQGPMAGKGAEIESEHEDLYNELASLVPGGMPISKEAFFEKIAKTHIKEDPDYYKKLEKYVEPKADSSKKPYYLLTKEETIAERDRLEANNTDPQRLKDLCRYSYTKFKTLLKDLK